MSASFELRLGTRGSALALWQARTVADRVAAAGGPPCRIVTIRTSGDRLQDAPLSEVGGKRLFVKEIEDALLQGEIDLAVHSSKDMPAVHVDGLQVAAVLPREDPRDAVVLPAARTRPLATIDALLSTLGQSPAFGTGSVRRVAQLKRLFPNARFAPIRGNLDTRLRKLDEGQHDALVLAAAGLKRLGFGDRIALALPAEGCLPAPGQGIVAVEVREGNARTREAVARIDHPGTAIALEAERSLVAALGGGCQTPVAALAAVTGLTEIELTAAVIALDGTRVVRGSGRGRASDARGVGARLAAQLLEQGADDILADVRRAAAQDQPGGDRPGT